MGSKPILQRSDNVLRQGPDQIYETNNDHIYIVKFKAGDGRLVPGQETSERQLRSMAKILERPKTSVVSATERSAQQRALERVRDGGKMTVKVFQTEQVLGKPGPTALKSSKTAGPADAKLAGVILEELGICLPYASKVVGVLLLVDKTAGVIGLAIDGKDRIDRAMETEQKAHDGKIPDRDPVLDHGKNAAEMADGWYGAYVGAEAGGMGGAALGTAVCPGLGTPIGAFIGTLGGGIAGYMCGETVAEHAAENAMTKVVDVVLPEDTAIPVQVVTTPVGEIIPEVVADEPWQSTDESVFCYHQGMLVYRDDCEHDWCKMERQKCEQKRPRTQTMQEIAAPIDAKGPAICPLTPRENWSDRISNAAASGWSWYKWYANWAANARWLFGNYTACRSCEWPASTAIMSFAGT
jgi:hypothetical protein